MACPQDGFYVQEPGDLSRFGDDRRSRLGFGEYRVPEHAPADPAGLMAMEMFFEALDRLVPEAKVALRDNVLEPLRTATRTEDGEYRWLESYEALEDLASQDRACQALRDTLQSWAARFRLGTTSLLDVALATLQAWEAYQPLHEDVFPIYREVTQDHGLLLVGKSARYESLSTLVEFLKRPTPEWAPAIQALQRWGREMGVGQAGLVHAVATLDRWSDSSNPMWFQWAPRRRRVFLLDTECFRFSTVGWSPCNEPRPQARKRIKDAFKQRLNEYLDKVEHEAKTAGMERTPQELREEDFERLVCFQVQGLNIAEIVRNHCESEDDEDSRESARKVVPARIDQAAQLVAGPSWKEWLRPRKPGAPKREKPTA